MTQHVSSGEVPDWRRIWEQTAVVLRGHVDGGLRRLLTEDVVRFALITALVRQGLDPQRITVETRDPALPGGRLDLVVDAGSEAAHVVEIKFPRDPSSSGAADTMTLGELLSDLYRLSLVTCDRRYAVQIIDRRLLGYLDGRAPLLGRLWPRHGDQFRLTPQMIGLLPKTATSMLPARAVEVIATARCVEQISLDDGLVLLVHQVDPAEEAETGRELTVAPPPSESAPPEEVSEAAVPPGRLGGARTAILDVVAALTVHRSVADTALDDIVREMKRRGSQYADTTVRTMVSSHMLNGGPGDAKPDLQRVGRGRYRIFRRPDAPASGGRHDG